MLQSHHRVAIISALLAEGVFGLRRPLEEAGAQSVLMSLWSVPDRETLQLMQLFYKAWLSGTEIHEALRQVQFEMRREVKKSHGGADLLLGRVRFGGTMILG